MRAFNRRRGPKHRTKAVYRTEYKWDHAKDEIIGVKVLKHCRPTKRISFEETDSNYGFSLCYYKLKWDGKVLDLKK